MTETNSNLGGELSEARPRIADTIRDRLYNDPSLYVAGEITADLCQGSVLARNSTIIISPVTPTFDPETLNDLTATIIDGIDEARYFHARALGDGGIRLPLAMVRQCLGVIEGMAPEIEGGTSEFDGPQMLMHPAPVGRSGPSRRSIAQDTEVMVCPDPVFAANKFASLAVASAQQEYGGSNGFLETTAGLQTVSKEEVDAANARRS